MTNSTLGFHPAQSSRIPGLGQRTRCCCPGLTAAKQEEPLKPGVLLPAWKLPCHDANSNKPEQEGICSRPTRPPFSPWSSSLASLSSVFQCKMKTPRWTAGGKSSALDPLYHGSLGKEKAKNRTVPPQLYIPKGLPLQHHHYSKTWYQI